MREFSRLCRLVCCALAFTFGSAAVASADEGEAIFVLSTSEVGAPTYDPIRAILLNFGTSLIYDTLVVRDADQSVHPLLAESWESSPDGMIWTFNLRQGVTFHNGEPFNAETVARWIPSFEGSENAYLVGAIESVEVVDDHTVRFIMARPEPNLLYNLSTVFMGIPEPNAYEALGEDYGVTEAVGTGPYMLESFDIGQQTVLVRNDDYTWGSALSENKGPAKIERLVLREIPEQSTAFLELKTGGVDLLLSVPADFLAELESQPDTTLVTIPGTELMYMPINVTSDPFTDIKVRQATALAINQAEILDSIYSGVGLEAHNFLISSLPESNVDPAYNISFDPEKANQILEEAGWTVGADGVREKAGQPLEVSLWTQSETEFKRVTEAVQAQLMAIGMKADIQVFDSSTIRDQYKKNEHQIAVRSYGWDNADILDWFFSGERLGYPNISMWNDPKSEELNIKAMQESRTPEERAANFTELHEYLLSQFVFAPIYQPVQSLAYNNSRLQLPATIRGPQFESQSVMDVELID